MRIIQIIPSISLVYGGQSHRAIGLSAALAAKNINVTILTTDSNGDIRQLPLGIYSGLLSSSTNLCTVVEGLSVSGLG